MTTWPIILWTAVVLIGIFVAFFALIGFIQWLLSKDLFRGWDDNKKPTGGAPPFGVLQEMYEPTIQHVHNIEEEQADLHDDAGPGKDPKPRGKAAD